jgi:hypothetical protein
MSEKAEADYRLSFHMSICPELAGYDISPALYPLRTASEISPEVM